MNHHHLKSFLTRITFGMDHLEPAQSLISLLSPTPPFFFPRKASHIPEVVYIVGTYKTENPGHEL